jgi:hypothetical protein
VKSRWSISVYPGTALEGEKVIKSCSSGTPLIAQSKRGYDVSSNLLLMERSLAWLLKFIGMTKLEPMLKVTLKARKQSLHAGTTVQRAEDFASCLSHWCVRLID